jgi:hypothetical protein
MLRLVGIEDPFVFPYRLVLTHADGSVRTLDPEFLPLPVEVDPAVSLTFSDIPGTWQVERVEDQAEFTFTESVFQADPTLRVAIAFLREVEPE